MGEDVGKRMKRKVWYKSEDMEQEEKKGGSRGTGTAKGEEQRHKGEEKL